MLVFICTCAFIYHMYPSKGEMTKLHANIKLHFFFKYIPQGKANIELELKNYIMKYDQEVMGHKETVAKFNADKKHILMSTEEANLEAMKGNLYVNKLELCQ